MEEASVQARRISYIPMRRGFMYLFAIIDVHSRFMVGWSLSITMSAEWCCSNCEDVSKISFIQKGTPTNALN
ncbi:MAG: hypothetical protein IJ986_02825 [Bacteroidales bacterium]|nr:hypothetical protein [Bacteroidales bacterium]